MSKRKTPTSSSEPTLTLISEQRPLAEQRRLDGTIGRVRVTIELLDDTLLTGWLEEADGQMKCARPPPHPTAVCAVLTELSQHARPRRAQRLAVCCRCVAGGGRQRAAQGAACARAGHSLPPPAAAHRCRAGHAREGAPPPHAARNTHSLRLGIAVLWRLFESPHAWPAPSNCSSGPSTKPRAPSASVSPRLRLRGQPRPFDGRPARSGPIRDPRRCCR